MRKLFYLAFVVVLAFAESTFASGVELELSLKSNTTLPGIPVAFKLAARNNSAAAVTFSHFVLLRVTPVGKTPFFALWLRGENPRYYGSILNRPNPATPLPHLEPGESKEFWFSVDEFLRTPACFDDERLSWPGTYRLQVILTKDPDQVLKSQLSSDSSVDKKSIVSNEIELRVEVPQAEDAVVWQRMLEMTEGRGWNVSRWAGFDLANEIWNKHRSSTYAAYIINLVRFDSSEEKFSVLKEFIEKNPSHPQAVPVLEELAASSEIEMENKLQHDDLSGAHNAYDNWQGYLKAVFSSNADPIQKDEAQRKMKSWDQILMDHQMQSPNPEVR